MAEKKEQEQPLITPEQVEKFLREERARREQEVQTHLRAIQALGYELTAEISVVDGLLVSKVVAVPKRAQ